MNFNKYYLHKLLTCKFYVRDADFLSSHPHCNFINEWAANSKCTLNYKVMCALWFSFDWTDTEWHCLGDGESEDGWM